MPRWTAEDAAACYWEPPILLPVRKREIKPRVVAQGIARPGWSANQWQTASEAAQEGRDGGE